MVQNVRMCTGNGRVLDVGMGTLNEVLQDVGIRTGKWNRYRMLECILEMEGFQDFGMGTGNWNGYQKMG